MNMSTQFENEPPIKLLDRLNLASTFYKVQFMIDESTFEGYDLVPIL